MQEKGPVEDLELHVDVQNGYVKLFGKAACRWGVRGRKVPLNSAARVSPERHVLKYVQEPQGSRKIIWYGTGFNYSAEVQVHNSYALSTVSGIRVIQEKIRNPHHQEPRLPESPSQGDSAR